MAHSSQPTLTFDEKKQIFIDALKASYKKQYDSVQPVPFIRDRHYCVNEVFVEGNIDGLIKVDGNKESWERLESYHDIFTDIRMHSSGRIIEGEPGYGKSTLTLQLAYDWCNGAKESPFADTDILILLKLRQLGDIRTLSRAIKLLLLREESSIRQSDIREILEKCKSVKLLLDGYDEYPERDSDTASDVNRMIKSETFNEFDINLTTRYLPKKFDKTQMKRAKLKGFDEKARDEYIRKAITGDNDQADFRKIKEGFKSNPILDDLCQVPLFFVTFAHMTHEREDFQMFKSVTDFFIYMIESFHRHTERKTEERNVRQYDFDLDTEHAELDKVALEGLNRDKQQLMWDRETLRKRLGEAFYDHYIRVGILVEEEVFDENAEDGQEIRIQVRFHHKIFCEWFASFEVMRIAAGVTSSDGLKDLIGKMDPFDLQYVYRFACGLNSKAASNIITYLKARDDCDKFAILCILEQNGGIEEIRNTVKELCSKTVFINRDDTNLLQRSTLQLLQIASSHDILISHIMLLWSIAKVHGTTVTLKSGMILPKLTSLKIMDVYCGPDRQEFTEEEVVGLIAYAIQSNKFTTLRFENSYLPNITPRLIPEEAKSRNIRVIWQNNSSKFDMNSGRWKEVDDAPTITEICSEAVVLNNADSVPTQKLAIFRMKKASTQGIEIFMVSLHKSFKAVDKHRNITLRSGLSLPPLTSLERITVQTEDGREMNQQEVIGILSYAQNSRSVTYVVFKHCLLPSTVHLDQSLTLLSSRNPKVLWMPYGFNEGHYKLDMKYGYWRLTFGDFTRFPGKKMGDTLTEAEYTDERENFRHHYRNELPQRNRIASMK